MSGGAQAGMEGMGLAGALLNREAEPGGRSIGAVPPLAMAPAGWRIIEPHR